MKTTLFAVLLCFIVSDTAIANSQLSNSLDAIFKDINLQTPGCNVGVVKNGLLIHQKGYGSANLELQVPLSGNNVHRIASVSKQFTAMAVLLLADQGKITLQDDIRKHLPSLPDYGHKVSINNILGHTAGMADYDFISAEFDGSQKNGLNLKNSFGQDFRLGNQDYLSNEQFYPLLYQVGLRQPPEIKWDYSNLGYIVLTMLIEEVSGKSLRQYSHENIFQPLGMNRTFFADDAVEIIKDRAYGYVANAHGEFVNDMTNLFWVGDGGLHTNIQDMLLWDQNFKNPQLGKSPKRLMTQFNTANSALYVDDDTDIQYANGQFVTKGHIIEEDIEYVTWHHSGGWHGTSTWYQRYPELDFSFMLFCNDAGMELTPYAEAISALFIEDFLVQKKR